MEQWLCEEVLDSGHVDPKEVQMESRRSPTFQSGSESVVRFRKLLHPISDTSLTHPKTDDSCARCSLPNFGNFILTSRRQALSQLQISTITTLS